MDSPPSFDGDTFELQDFSAAGFEYFGGMDAGWLAFAFSVFIPFEIVNAVIGIVPNQFAFRSLEDGYADPSLVASDTKKHVDAKHLGKRIAMASAWCPLLSIIRTPRQLTLCGSVLR